MSKRILVLVSFLIYASSASAMEAVKRPNIIVMMTDDQRADFMSGAGHPFIKTPNMDRIGKEGAAFKNMFVTNALCAPSRATLMSGLYSHANGVIDNMGTKLKADITWMPDVLRANGYEVGFVGKSHVPGHFRDRKWDYYFGFTGQGNYQNARIAESLPDGTIGPDKPYDGWMDDITTERAITWMNRDRGTKPFALFLFFKAPHRQWNPPARYKNLYADAVIKKPALWDDTGAGKPRAFLQAANMFGQFPDTKNYDEMVRDYCRCITGVDDNVGKVLKALEDKQRLDDTAVMYTSDNGFFLGEWQRFDKRFMHEPSIRVPMLVRYPKAVKAGQTPTEMAINVDIAPTILNLAGLVYPKEMQGRSLTELITTPKVTDNAKPWRDAWYYEYHEFPDPSHNVNKHRGVRTDQYKFIHYYEPPFQFREEFELYDLKADPEERTNLAALPKHQAVIATMKAKLEMLRSELGAK